FEHVVRNKRSGKLERVSEELGLNERWLRKVYAAYRGQAKWLRDEWRPAGKIERVLLRGCGSPPPDPRPKLPPMKWDAVFHWFAHALRNLSRYRDNHPKLPWSKNCAARCLANRDRLANRSSVSAHQLVENCD